MKNKTTLINFQTGLELFPMMFLWFQKVSIETVVGSSKVKEVHVFDK